MKFLQDSVYQKSPKIGCILTELFKKYEVDIFRDTVCSSLADTLSVYQSRFGALPSIGSAIFAVHTV